MKDVPEAIEAVWKIESTQLVAAQHALQLTSVTVGAARLPMALAGECL